jgi:hypothetical protein
MRPKPAAASTHRASGTTVTAILLVQDVSAYSGFGNPCDPVTTAGVRVYPPNRYTAKIVPFPIYAARCQD